MPRYGVNLQWLFSKRAAPRGPDERVLDALAAWGFDFVRLPTDYRLWSVDGDPYRPDERVLALIDQTLAACRARGRRSSAARWPPSAPVRRTVHW